MSIVRATSRGFKFLRNSSMFIMGALIVILSVVFPRMFSSTGNHALYGADIANADAPSGSDGSSGGSSSGCASEGCGCGDGGGCAGCGDGGGSDCCGGK